MSRMSNTSWIVLMVIVAVVDFIQLVIIEGLLVWFWGIGTAINEVLDPIVGVLIGGFLTMKGVTVISRPNRLLALASAEIAAAISAGVAQCWILSVWYIRNDVRSEEAEILAAESRAAHANQNGRREPPPRIVANNGGVRAGGQDL